MGKDKSVKKRKLPDIKSLIFGSNKETTIPGSRFPNGTQSLVPVVDIRNGVIITEDGRYLKIIEVLPTNFYLKSSMEQMNIIYYTENKTLAYKLYEAQTYYEAGNYSQAIAIYSNYADESAIACLNLGYMYSNGLGVNFNYKTACTYYQEAYEKGLAMGMSNYIALNLQRPQSYSDVTNALTYGINRGYVKAMLFATYFETGKMYADYSKEVFEHAVDFINRPQYEQDVKMKDKIYIYEVGLEKTYSESIPISTDFIKYNKTDIESVQPKDLKLVSALEFVEDGEYREEYVPVVDLDIIFYYQIYKYSFHCSRDLLEESFYYAVVE